MYARLASSAANVTTRGKPRPSMDHTEHDDEEDTAYKDTSPMPAHLLAGSINAAEPSRSDRENRSTSSRSRGDREDRSTSSSSSKNDRARQAAAARYSTSLAFSPRTQTPREVLFKLAPRAHSALQPSSWQSRPWLPPYRGFRRCMFAITDEPNSSFVSLIVWYIIMILIFTSVIASVLETLPQYRFPAYGNSEVDNPRVFDVIELITQISFTVEYVVRLCCVTSLHYRELGIKMPAKYREGKKVIPEWNMRMRKIVTFVINPYNVIDLVAFMPFYIELALQMSMRLQFFRVLRVLRIFRVMKLGKYSEGMRMLGRVMVRSSPALTLLLILLIVAGFLFASLIFFAEQGNFDAVTGLYMRPDLTGEALEISPFRSIVDGFYWVYMTTTTVGYGDYYPTSTFGKIIAVILMHVGIVAIALPITIIGSNFATEYERRRFSALVEDERDPRSNFNGSDNDEVSDDWSVVSSEVSFTPTNKRLRRRRAARKRKRLRSLMTIREHLNQLQAEINAMQDSIEDDSDGEESEDEQDVDDQQTKQAKEDARTRRNFFLRLGRRRRGNESGDVTDIGVPDDAPLDGIYPAGNSMPAHFSGSIDFSSFFKPAGSPKNPEAAVASAWEAASAAQEEAQLKRSESLPSPFFLTHKDSISKSASALPSASASLLHHSASLGAIESAAPRSPPKPAFYPDSIAGSDGSLVGDNHYMSSSEPDDIFPTDSVWMRIRRGFSRVFGAIYYFFSFAWCRSNPITKSHLEYNDTYERMYAEALLYDPKDEVADSDSGADASSPRAKSRSKSKGEVRRKSKSRLRSTSFGKRPRAALASKRGSEILMTAPTNLGHVN